MTAVERAAELSTWLAALFDAQVVALVKRREHLAGKTRCVNYEGQPPEHYTEYDACFVHLQLAEAVDYRDVEFGLRDIDAKRRILVVRDEAAASYARDRGDVGKAADADAMDWCVKLLGMAYADRDGYRQEWG